MADFARASAWSFPLSLLWPFIHVTVCLPDCIKPLVASTNHRCRTIGLLLSIAWHAPRLSHLIVVGLQASVAANAIPISSAGYMPGGPGVVHTNASPLGFTAALAGGSGG